MAALVFVLLALLFGYAGWYVMTNWLGRSVDQLSFFCGVGVTLVAAFITFRLQNWGNAATRPGRPQTVTLQTRETPAQITRASLAAILWIILTLLLVSAVAYVFLFVQP